MLNPPNLPSKTCDEWKSRRTGQRPAPGQISLKSALARLEAALDLIDHVDPALAADQTVVAMTTTQRFQRVTDLHGTFLMLERPYSARSSGSPENTRGRPQLLIKGFIPLTAEPPGTRVSKPLGPQMSIRRCRFGPFLPNQGLFRRKSACPGAPWKRLAFQSGGNSTVASPVATFSPA